METQNRRERKQQMRQVRNKSSNNLGIVLLISGVCLSFTCGVVYFGLVNGWDSIVPGRTGGFRISTGLLFALVIDLTGAGFLYAIFNTKKKKSRAR